MRRLLVFATCLSFVGCNSSTMPRSSPVEGTLVGESRGFRIRLNVTERRHNAESSGYYELVGSGTLTTIASSDSVPFVIDGFGGALWSLSMLAVDPSRPKGTGNSLGVISGSIDDTGALVGTLDGRAQSTVGPLANPPFGPAPITLRPQ
jgi:hypothetical protein